MKKALKLVSLFLVCVMLSVMMASCTPKKEQNSGSGAASDITSSDNQSQGDNTTNTDNDNNDGDKEPSGDTDTTSSKGDNTVIRPDKKPSGNTSSTKPNPEEEDPIEEEDYNNNDSQNGSGNNNNNNNNNNNTGNTSSGGGSGSGSTQTGFVYTPIDTTGMTDNQKAVVLTGESYWIRQSRLQYEDTRINNTKSRDQWRWGYIKLNSPENYTSQDVWYSNCAAWTHEAYWNAFDLDIKQYQTAQLCALDTSDKRVVFKATKSSFTPENIEKYEKQIKDLLQPGDLVVYIRDSGTGHVMMYVGNNMMLHCTGSSYSWTNKAEKYEANGGIRYDPIDGWFEEGNSRYLFDKKTTSIVRPLNTYTGTIPQKTLDRMTTMRGVVAEKLCSAYKGVTVNEGQEITYTIKLTNYASDKKTLDVTDVVPANTTYVSGAQSKNGDNLSWKVTVEAGKSASVSYKVKVNSGAADKTIKGDSGKVESIDLKCHDLYVKKTLTKAEQDKVVAAAKKLMTSDKKDIELAAAIYKEAFGKSELEGKSASDVLKAVFKNYAGSSAWPSRWQQPNTTSSTLKSMLAPDLYGGRQVIDPDGKINSGQGIERIRLVTKDNLVVGDILVTNNPEKETYTTTEYTFQPVTYIFLGDKLLNMSTMKEIDLEPTLEQILCERHFCVIRPSIVM